jgi:uncharacterized protein YndB with AHSA1/START domain
LTDFVVEEERLIAASPERVYAAWTQPATFAAWFVPEALDATKVILDAQIGGEFRVEMTGPEDRYVVYGAFTRIEANRRLEFTWQWEESSVEKGVSLVTVTLTPEASGTRLHLTHQQLANEVSQDRHRSGWSTLLGRLESLLQNPKET